MRRYCSTASFAGSSTTWGGTGRLVADAIDQQLFEPGEWGLRDVLSGHFCMSLHVGHARRIRPLFNYRIKTNKTKHPLVKFLEKVSNTTSLFQISKEHYHKYQATKSSVTITFSYVHQNLALKNPMSKIQNNLTPLSMAH